MNLASSSTGVIKNIKKEPEDKKKAEDRRSRSGSPKRRRYSSSRSSRSSSSSRSRSPRRKESGVSKPAVVQEEPIVREEKEVQEEEIEPIPEEVAPPKQQIRMTLKSSNPLQKAANKNVLETLGSSDNNASEILENAKAKREENKLKKATEIKKEKKEKKEKKSAADRREELLKQLKAVENAIAKKRTKIDKESSKK